MTAKAKKQPKKGNKSQKSIYLNDSLWDRIAKEADKQDRSINYVVEKKLAEIYCNKLSELKTL